MDDKDLKIFLTLADTGNLTRTAELLYLTQPTLSKRLQNMEAELGATLFLRGKHGATLTPAGEAARKTIQRTVKDFEALRELYQRDRDSVCGTLRIGCSLDYSTYRLPGVLSQYTKDYPQVTLQVFSDHSPYCARQLQEGRLHLAIVRGSYSWEGESVLLEQEPVCLIRPKNSLSTPLSKLSYIDRESNWEHMSQKSRWLMENGLEPSTNLTMNGLSACVSMVEAGVGWSIVPQICLSEFDGVAEPLHFADGTPFTRSTYLVFRRRELELPQVKAFVETVCRLSGAKLPEV